MAGEKEDPDVVKRLGKEADTCMQLSAMAVFIANVHRTIEEREHWGGHGHSRL